MESESLRKFMEEYWDNSILPPLMDYITIPCLSPAFDHDWDGNGHLLRAAELVAGWIKGQGLPGCRVQVLREEGRTPVVLAEIEGNVGGGAGGGASGDTVFIYGHLDKQPPMNGWREGLGPWSPVLDEQGRLYGRGGADDGYAPFAAVAALKALAGMNQGQARTVLFIECSEESGSPDLPYYLASHAAEIGAPSLVIALDSGCGNYDQLWNTTSLRGILEVGLKVEVLSEGVHSGLGGGVIPDTFRIVRLLLDRLEEQKSGEFRLPELLVDIPPRRIDQARQAAKVLGSSAVAGFPLLEGVRPLSDNLVELLLNNAWKPALIVTGQEGIPQLGQGGNVLRPSLELKLSIRLPPGIEPGAAGEAVRETLEADPPHGARITVTTKGQDGWNAPRPAPWLSEALDGDSNEFFGQKACHFGLGGTIPFMRMMGEKFPQAQFLITGVLGPHANAHGPNEFLHLPYTKKLTCCLARILALHHGRPL